MNLLDPVSSIMTRTLITIGPKDRLIEAKKKFEESNIHHLPVVRYTTLVGMLSKTDLLHFMRGYAQSEGDRFIEDARLNAFRVEEIMTTKLAKIESREPIRTALELFKINRFHALPIVDNDELTGILTTHDIITALADDPISLDDYKTNS